MQTAALADWLRSPETQALLTYLRFRQEPAISMLLQGVPVPPETQAKAAGCNEIERLLKQSPDKIKEIFENAAKEMNR